MKKIGKISKIYVLFATKDALPERHRIIRQVHSEEKQRKLLLRGFLLGNMNS